MNHSEHFQNNQKHKIKKINPSHYTFMERYLINEASDMNVVFGKAVADRVA